MAAATSHRPPRAPGFIGREAELALVRGLLRQSRLVTVTGPPGVGKTRLALRTTDELAGRPEQADRFGDGVHVIELSTVRDPGLLAGAIAAGLTGAGLTGAAEPDGAEDGAGSPLSRLLGFLRDRRLLLLLDTCEHLVDECAALADAVLRAAPGVAILATSRQPLDTAGEAVFQLRPLPVPAPETAAASQADAVVLFAQRAAAAVPGFALTPGNLQDVITVCRRLDGLPLAIELAALRLHALPLPQLAARGDDRLGLLTGARRSGPPRHQTLRAAIE
ncbi:MAG TPA: AAA family ATPase, partial [Trebonia sp.]